MTIRDSSWLMSDCNGAELLSELLYHWGAKDQIPEILKTVKVIPHLRSTHQDTKCGSSPGRPRRCTTATSQPKG